MSGVMPFVQLFHSVLKFYQKSVITSKASITVHKHWLKLILKSISKIQKFLKR